MPAEARGSGFPDGDVCKGGGVGHLWSPQMAHTFFAHQDFKWGGRGYTARKDIRDKQRHKEQTKQHKLGAAGRCVC